MCSDRDPLVESDGDPTGALGCYLVLGAVLLVAAAVLIGGCVVRSVRRYFRNRREAATFDGALDEVAALCSVSGEPRAELPPIDTLNRKSLPATERLADGTRLEGAVPVPSIEAGILILDKETRSIHDQHFRLPDSLRAKAPEEVKTVAVVEWRVGPKICEYSDGTPGHAMLGTVKVMDVASERNVHEAALQGSEPPYSLPDFQEGPDARVAGPLPDVAGYLQYLHSGEPARLLELEDTTEIVQRNVPATNEDRGDTYSQRTWTDRTGCFQVETAFVSWDGVNVRLRKADGAGTIVVPFEELSEEDQKWLERAMEISDNPFEPKP